MKIYLRTILKGIIWEMLGVFTALLIFKKWEEIGLYFLIRILTYYYFHRLFKLIPFWKTIKIKDKKQ